MKFRSAEYDAVVARHPFLADILNAVFPMGDDEVLYEDDVEIGEVTPDEVMYPRSLVWRPNDGTPSPFERPGGRRRVIACLSDATRVVRILSLQEYGDAVPWELLRETVEIGRFKQAQNVRLPGHVFVLSSYEPRLEGETLWFDELSLAMVTVWTCPVAENSFSRSATVQFARRPESGFQVYQRA